MFGGFLGRETWKQQGALVAWWVKQVWSCVFEVILELPDRLPTHGLVPLMFDDCGGSTRINIAKVAKATGFSRCFSIDTLEEAWKHVNKKPLKLKTNLKVV